MTLLLLADAIFFKNTFDTLVYFLTLVLVFFKIFSLVGRRDRRRARMGSKIRRGLCRKHGFGARFVPWAAMGCWVSQTYRYISS